MPKNSRSSLCIIQSLDNSYQVLCIIVFPPELVQENHHLQRISKVPEVFLKSTPGAGLQTYQ